MASRVVSAVSYDVLWYYSAPMARRSRATPALVTVFPSPPAHEQRARPDASLLQCFIRDRRGRLQLLLQGRAQVLKLLP